MRGERIIRRKWGERRKGKTDWAAVDALTDKEIEAAVRDERWKLVFQRGRKHRADGYDTGLPLPGRTIRLYDLQSDPAELHNVANLPENAERGKRMIVLLADHLKVTAREPQLVPIFFSSSTSSATVESCS